MRGIFAAVKRPVLRIGRFFACLFGIHGVPVGAIQVQRYDVHQRIFRYDSWMRCPYCSKRME